MTNFSQLIDKGVGKLSSWKGIEPFFSPHTHLLFYLVLLGFPCAILKMLIMSLDRKWCFDLFVVFFYYNKNKYSRFSCLNICVHAAAQQMQQTSSLSSLWCQLGSTGWKTTQAICAKYCYWMWLLLPLAKTGCKQYFSFCKHCGILSRPHSWGLTQLGRGEWRQDSRFSISVGFVQPVLI